MTTRFRKQLPANCYLDKGVYVEFRKQIDGVKYKASLGKMSDGIAVILERYQAIINDIEGKATRPRYRTASGILTHVMANGKQMAQMPLNALTKPLMQKLMEARLYSQIFN